MPVLERVARYWGDAEDAEEVRFRTIELTVTTSSNGGTILRRLEAIGLFAERADRLAALHMPVLSNEIRYRP